jgi:SAM-dependent methyltransferase
MGGYGKFAWFYDRLQQDVPYKAMAELFDRLIKKYSAEKDVVVDIACGTGSLCFEMEKLGYDVIGTDISEQMLNEAMDKRYDLGSSADFLCQNMTELDLFGAADVILCTLDSLNHLSSFDEVCKTFERASQYVCDGGLFIFDVNTLFKHREVLGDNAFVYDLEGLFCSWQNQLCEDGSVDIFLDFFEREEDGKYSRYSESFTEKYFPTESIDKALGENNFEIIGRFDDFTENPVCDTTQRVLYVCRRAERK